MPGEGTQRSSNTLLLRNTQVQGTRMLSFIFPWIMTPRRLLSLNEKILTPIRNPSIVGLFYCKFSKKSPTLFGESHAKDLGDLQFENGAVLQYVDDILIASPDKDTSTRNTLLTLSHLAKKTYQVPQKKAQIFKPEVRYLGLLISHDQEAYVRSAVIASQALPGNQVAE